MGRLMKYELRSAMKLFLPLWLAVLVLAGINRLTFNSNMFDMPNGNAAAFRFLEWLSGIAMFLFVVAIMGVFVVALIFVIQRFYQGLLKDEGYLTFTLPVRTDSILWAKTFSAMILIAASVVVCLAAVLILGASRELWKNLAWGWQWLMKYSGRGDVILACILGFILAIAAMIPSVQYLYLSMSIGHLAQKHRAAASVGAFVGIDILLNLVSSLALSPILNRMMESGIVWWDRDPDVTAVIWLIFGVLLAICLIQTVIFYFPTRYILNKHLNLE